MKTEKMWAYLAKYYDSQYYWKDYKKEAKTLEKIIKKHKKTNDKELLDIACGTGNHIEFLKNKFKITGVDLNSGMLKQARSKFPKIKFYKANMINLNLKKEFDIIVCLFSSIAYVKTYKNLEKTLNNFYNRLKPGGVVIIEPFVHPRLYKTKKPAKFLIVDEPELKMVRINDSKRIGKTAVLDFHFLISTKKGVEYVRDIQEIGLFDPNKFKKIMNKQGFKNVQYLKNGLMKDRGLYIAIK